MFIIDGDVHISSVSSPNKITIEELIDLMDRCGVDMAVTWPMLSYDKRVDADNAAIYKGMKRYPNRIVGFGGINPMLGMHESLDELSRCIEEYGFRGIKLNGARDGYVVDDETLVYPIVERIAEKGLILAIHSGINDASRSHPWHVGNIAARYPELRILMVHMGGAGIPGLYNAAIRIARQHKNIFLIGSEADPKAILQAVSELGPDRVCYGSDVPFSLMKVCLAMYDALLENLPEGDRSWVMGKSLGSILGLDIPSGD